MGALFELNNLQILALLPATIFLAWMMRAILARALKSLFKRTETTIDDKIIKTLENPIFWSIILIGSYVFLKRLSIPENILIPSLNFFKTAGVIIWSQTLVKISIILIVELQQRKSKRKKFVDIIPLLKTVSKIVIFTIAIITTLNIWEVDVTPILASAGIAGFAAAFAAKDTVSNLFGGISVFLDKPYAVKDYVIIDDKYRGEVIEIGIRSTKIRTRDDVLLTVPNSVMVTKAVINETGLDGKLRVRVPIGIAPGTDLEKTEKIIVKILKKHSEILKDPAPRIRYRKFGEFTVDLEALFVISNPANRGRITHEVIKKLDKGLREEKIELPFPQLAVKLENN
ncbi:mechanosensitive ion channel family protein [Patescibacteria group bacterium]